MNNIDDRLAELNLDGLFTLPLGESA